MPVRRTSSPSHAFKSFKIPRCCCLILMYSDRNAEHRGEVVVVCPACPSIIVSYCLSRSCIQM